MNIEKERAIYELEKLKLGKKHDSVLNIIENIFSYFERQEYYNDMDSLKHLQELKKINPKAYNSKVLSEYSLFRNANSYYDKKENKGNIPKFNRLEKALWYAITNLSKLDSNSYIIELYKAGFDSVEFIELYERYKKFRHISKKSSKGTN